MQRFLLAIRCFWSVLLGRVAVERVRSVIEPELSKPPAALPAGAVQILALLQREGRLVDFLGEEIDQYNDAQIGAAVRDIHRGCSRVLRECVNLQPILNQPEESAVDVPVGFDPAQIRLTGNVHGDPPFHGTLKHHGWLVRGFTMPESAANDARVVAPAEVEIG